VRGDLARERERGVLGRGGRHDAVHEPEPEGLVRADRAAREDEVLGHGEAHERHEPRRPDRRPHPRAGPHEAQRVGGDAQVAARGELGAGAHDVPHADGDRGYRERADGRVHAREGLHARHGAIVAELLAEVGAGAQRPRVGRRENERAQGRVGGELVEALLQLAQRDGVERVARLRAIEPQDLDPGVEALASQAGHRVRVL
jgi:hypothetical protein